MKEQKLDAGFAFDGDADRCLAVDENGDVVDGDKILYIYGSYMKEKGTLEHNTVVTTVMSNIGLYKAFDELGINYEKTAVGDKYVYECMNEHGYKLGGENSGHIIFSKYANTGDGIITAIKLMQVMCSKKSTLAKLCAPLTIYPQLLKNVRVTDKNAVLNDPDVIASVKKAEEELGTNGRMLVRPSGTEPLLRIMAEAQTKELCDKYVTMVENTVREKGFII